MGASPAKLSVTLPSDLEIRMTRVFAAPPPLVYEAHTRPEHLVRWWGPRGFTLPVCQIDLRPSGAYRFVQRGPDGKKFAFKGVYREIVPPERLVNTFEYEGMPGYVLLQILTLAVHEGGTRLTSRSLFWTVEDRDGMLRSGMEQGASESFERLAEYLGALS
jgi:uncharacterized protein YndB with AHSA1/START domain